MNNKGENREWFKYLKDWVVFGASEAFSNSAIHVIDIDLNESNLIRSKDRIYQVDYGGSTTIKYPEQWQKICLSLMSFFRWADIDKAAAFRFGYLHTSGLVGEVVFDRMRDIFGLNAFKIFQNINYNPFSDIYDTDDDNDLNPDIYKKDEDWIRVRDKNLRYGCIHKNRILPDHIRQWLSQRNSFELEQDLLLKADEYHFKKHLVSAYWSGNVNDFLFAVLNLHNILIYQQKGVVASGYLYLAQKVYEKFQENLSKTNWEDLIKESMKNAEYYYDIHVKDIEFIESRNNILQKNIYHLIWCFDDLQEGEISINNH